MRKAAVIFPALAMCIAYLVDLPLYAQLPPVPAGTTAIAQGIWGPRGLKFGPDGNLYVALSGSGGTNSTGPIGSDTCPELQVPMAVGGPYTNGNTASIIKIDGQGNATTVAFGFPSALSQRPDINGVADVAFLDGELYAVTAGGGCSHGSLTPNMVAKVDLASGTWTMLSNMSAAVVATPAARVGVDFEADGVFYSMIAVRGKLYAIDTNHAQAWSITKEGEVEMVTDFSQTFGADFDPTTSVESPGGLLVGTLGQFPIAPGLSDLVTLQPGCDTTASCGPGTLHVSGWKSGYTTILGMDYGPDGLLYLLELSDAPGLPAPGFGKVVRIRNGVAEDVITDLSVPTGMTFGPDGYLYISNWGAAPAPVGQILRVTIK